MDISLIHQELSKVFYYYYNNIDVILFKKFINICFALGCDDGCATCSEAGSCIIYCNTNCSRCLPDLTCT